MGLEGDKPVRFGDRPAIGTGNEYVDEYRRTAAGGKLDLDTDISQRDHLIEIPINYDYKEGSQVMGDPVMPFINSRNSDSSTWAAPQLMADQSESDGASPPRTPSGRCKAPFVPSFKSVAKLLSFPSILLAQIDAFMERLNRWSKNADSLAENFWSHMKLGSSVSETVWGKVNLGAKIVTEGGLENLFKLSFSVGPREELLKTSACYLSTTTGPVVGLLFISTEKLAFCSDRPLSFTSPSGEVGCSYYRVAIPRGRLRSVNPCENVNKPSEKYIQILTVDDHEFWFMGFVNYRKVFKYLQEAVSPRFKF